jgi:hypothetical protein
MTARTTTSRKPRKSTKAGVTSRVGTVTPAMAAEFLEKNSINRHPTESTIRKYAADMRSLRWQCGTGAIVFAADGTLLDGQQRLMACVRAEVPFDTAIIEGADISAMHNIDQGKPRSFAVVLGWMGEKNCTSLASAIRLGWLWHRGDPFDRVSVPTVEEQLDWLRDNPSIREALIRAMPFRRQWGCPIGALALVVHRIGLIDQEAADLFLDEVATGADLPVGSPTLALRNWLSSQLLAGATTTLTARRPLPGVYMTMWIKAWNAFVCGKEISQLRYVRRESFPDVLDLAGEPTKLVNEVSLT